MSEGDPLPSSRQGGPVASAAFAVAVFAKAPIPGLAKTRLIPALGARGAARLQRQLTRQALRVAQGASTRVTLWCAPDAAHPFFRTLARRCGVDCRTQCDGDLGQRMLHAFEAHAGPTPLLLIGCDCPALTADHLGAAGAALGEGQDAVLMPAEDGGYVLIGLRRPLPALFQGVAWGTDRVLDQTRAALRAIGARWREGETLWDVDRPGDLPRLVRHAGRPGPAHG